MFRLTHGIKGLIVDVASINKDELANMKALAEIRKCLFLVESKQREHEVRQVLGDGVSTLCVPWDEMDFVPNQKSHSQCLSELGMNTIDVCYVSSDAEFLRRAMGFLSGTVWISPKLEMTYEEASHVADYVARDIPMLVKYIEGGYGGFLGEQTFLLGGGRQALAPIVALDVDGRTFHMTMLGRYFGQGHYMSQMHPYSTAILLNKREGKTYYGVFNNIFETLYIKAVERILRKETISGLLAVPPKPNKKDRFGTIVSNIAQKCNIRDMSEKMHIEGRITPQKALNAISRADNIKEAFQCEKMDGEDVILLDDVSTTGETIRECIRTLKRAGCGKIFPVVLAVNQYKEPYWGSYAPKVKCPSCGVGMGLLVNGKTAQFFYHCYNCNSNLSFLDGRKSSYRFSAEEDENYFEMKK